MTRAAWRASVLGSINVIVAVLAIRLILLVSVFGAIALAWYAIAVADPFRLVAVGIYTGTVCLPLVWLAGRHP